MEPLNLEQFGGVADVQIQTLTGDLAPSEVPWNFGVQPETDEVTGLIQSTPSLYAHFPNLAGAWDGRSTVNHWSAAVKVLGDKAVELIQNQPRGTCGGRSGSAAIDLLQTILIAKGARAKFRRASHAFLYWLARRKYGMDKGTPTNKRNDGVPSGSIPEVLTTFGIDHREETGDNLYYGDGSDDLAVRWGCGLIDPALAARLIELAKDNVVTAWAPVNSAAELADGIAAGGIGIGSDSRGFTMTRDAEGFCTPSGTWYHYHVRCSVFKNARGRRGFGYFQSWGRDNPRGPLLDGHPGNCFGVDWEVQDAVCKSGRWAVVFGFPLWELERGPQDLPWVF